MSEERSKINITLHAKSQLFLSDFYHTWIFSTHFFAKYSNVKFHENPFRGSRVFPCERADRRTDRHDEVTIAFRNFAKAPKNYLKQVCAAWNGAGNHRELRRPFRSETQTFTTVLERRWNLALENKRFLPASALYPHSNIPPRSRSIISIVREKKYLFPDENSCKIQKW